MIIIFPHKTHAQKVNQTIINADKRDIFIREIALKMYISKQLVETNMIFDI